METLMFYIEDWLYWIVHLVGLWVMWDISNNRKLDDTIFNTPVCYFLIGVSTTQIATWADNLPKG